MDDFETFVKRSLKALNENKIDYVLVGGLAAIKYGRPRSTMDIDVIVRVDPKQRVHIDALLQTFTRYNLELDIKDLESSLLEGVHIPVFDRRSPYRIDLKHVRDTLDVASLRNRRKTEIFGIETWIESPEDLIIAKLVYGGQQDEEDVLAVILAQKDHLNIPYLRDRVKEEQVSERLLALFKELGLQPPWK